MLERNKTIAKILFILAAVLLVGIVLSFVLLHPKDLSWEVFRDPIRMFFAIAIGVLIARFPKLKTLQNKVSHKQRRLKKQEKQTPILDSNGYYKVMYGALAVVMVLMFGGLLFFDNENLIFFSTCAIMLAVVFYFAIKVNKCRCKL